MLDVIWVLFMLTIDARADEMTRIGEFETMNECFSAYEQIYHIEKPMINKGMICTRVEREYAAIDL